MRFRVVAAALWTLIIMVLCWTPQVYIQVDEGTGSLAHQLHLDKFIHAGIFTVFAVLWLRVRPGLKSKYLWVFLAGTALGAITEIVQNVPIIHRDGEFEDFLADFAGLLFGFPLYRWLMGNLTNRRPAEEPQPGASQEVAG